MNGPVFVATLQGSCTALLRSRRLIFPVICAWAMLALVSAHAQTDFVAMNRKCRGLYKAGALDSALIVAERMARAVLKEQGRGGAWLDSSMHHLGHIHEDLGKLKSESPDIGPAVEHYKKALMAFDVWPGKKDHHYVQCLNSLGLLYSSRHEYDSAHTYLTNALEIVRGSLGSRGAYRTYATILGNLGFLCKEMRMYDEAELFMTRSLHLEDSISGKMSLSYATGLKGLGNLYYETNAYELAERHYRDAMAIQAALPDGQVGHAKTLTDLGTLHMAMGENQKAMSYLQQARPVLAAAVGETHPDHITNMKSTGALYGIMGNHSSAAWYMNRALELCRERFGERSPRYASILIGCAKAYTDMEDYEAALHHYVMAKDVYEGTTGPWTLEYAMLLTDVGEICTFHGKYDESVRCFEKARDIMTALDMRWMDNYGAIIGNLGSTHFVRGDMTIAERYMRESIDIALKSGDRLNLETAYGNLADLLAATNRVEEVLGIGKEALAIYEDNLAKRSDRTAREFEWLNEAEKEKYWVKMQQYSDHIFRFGSGFQSRPTQAAGLCYNAALLAKSQLLQSRLAKQDVSHLPEVVSVQEQLARSRRLLAKLESDGSTDHTGMDRLRAKADSLDRQLALAWPDYAEQRRHLSTTWDQVQAHLAPDEAAIEFVRYVDVGDPEPKYQAIVVRKGDQWPVLVPLCSEQDVKALRPGDGFVDHYPLVWRPLEPWLKGIATIYYAPVAALNNVPFHGLVVEGDTLSVTASAPGLTRGTPVEEGGPVRSRVDLKHAVYLMDRYTLHQLTSTRYLAMGLKGREAETLDATAVLVGDIDYDRLPDGTRRPGPGGWSFLGGSAREVRDVAATLARRQWAVNALGRERATEESLMALTGKEAPSVLHISTHGFAYPEAGPSTVAWHGGLRMDQRRSRPDPMLRCGLILSGGNWSDTLQALGAKENGILTAKEVSELDLRRTKLVVLSACETGLGEVKSSEGTFGMKRGFKLAGVEQLIVSLWQVPDEATMELMTAFYTDLAESRTPVTAFARAQKAMREKYPGEPEKWAGFVLVR